jgi:hypothetical protein
VYLSVPEPKIPGLKYHIKEADRLMKMKKPEEKLNNSRKVITGSIQLQPPNSKQLYRNRTATNRNRKKTPSRLATITNTGQKKIT